MGCFGFIRIEQSLHEGPSSQFGLYEVEIQANNGPVRELPKVSEVSDEIQVELDLGTYSAMSMPQMPVPHPRSRMRGPSRLCIGAVK